MSSPLTQYTLQGLAHCYMPQKQCWSFIYHLDGRENPNESYAPSDCFYSLNVILGLATAGKETWEGVYDLPHLLQYNAKKLKTLPVKRYALGMALWASSILDEPLEDETAAYIDSQITNQRDWHRFTAQDAGMILSGLCQQKNHAIRENAEIAPELFSFIKQRFLIKSGLFRNNSCGLRKNFASFATQVYLINACYQFGISYDSTKALDIADNASRIMLSLQGKQGQWPWFYYAPKAKTVDSYEIYTVHQHSMASLFLNYAEQRGIEGAGQAIDSGFEWIMGNNDLQKNMMMPSLGMFYRSIARKGELHNRHKRLIRSAWRTLTGNPAAEKTELVIRKECRSYELGWLLFAFGNETRKPHITDHPAFNQITQSTSSISS